MNVLLDNYRLLAKYNTWLNSCLIDAASGLSDAQRREDLGAFFGSIHNTFNHIIWADMIWLNRFAAQAVESATLRSELIKLPPGSTHRTILFDDWADFCAARLNLDSLIEEWTGELTSTGVEGAMTYANMKGAIRVHETWKALTHFFNHQTHHRGQVTTLLFQLGVDPGTTDLIALA